jgi:hypothetical protein
MHAHDSFALRIAVALLALATGCTSAQPTSSVARPSPVSAPASAAPTPRDAVPPPAAASVAATAPAPPTEPDSDAERVEVSVHEQAAVSTAGSATMADIFTLPTDAPGNGASCIERRRFATAKMQGALQHVASTVCSADTDCVYVAVDTSCGGACRRVVHRDHEPGFAKLREQLDLQVCQGFRSAGCPYATPRCYGQHPVCREGRCAAGPR